MHKIKREIIVFTKQSRQLPDSTMLPALGYKRLQLNKEDNVKKRIHTINIVNRVRLNWKCAKLPKWNLPSFSVLLELFTIFMNSLSPSSLLMFSSVGGGIDSTGFPSAETKILSSSKVLFGCVAGGLGVNSGQSDASSSYVKRHASDLYYITLLSNIYSVSFFLFFTLSFSFLFFSFRFLYRSHTPFSKKHKMAKQICNGKR